MTGRARLLLLSMLLLWTQGSAAAVPAGYRLVAEAEGVPASVLYAVALAESGITLESGRRRPWPWSLNVEGRAQQPQARKPLPLACRDLVPADRARGVSRMIRVSPRLHLAGVLALLCSSSSWAAPTIIYDSGQTQPLAPYYESLRGEVPPPDTRPTPSGKADLTVEDLLPIDTPEMSPGLVQARAITLPKGVPLNAAGARPLFLIGADSLSRRWLARHRARLKEIGAMGMLVQARTAEELQAVARIAEGLRIIPASGTEIARLYGLKHYPVLIWRGRIEQ